MITRATSLIFAVALWATAEAAPPAAPPLLLCPCCEAPPVIDGVLDDAAWQSAPVRYPVRVAGQSPLYPSAVRLTWDAEALYVAFDCADADVRTSSAQRDALLYELGDCAELFILLPGSPTRKIELEVNPANGFLDILHEPGRTFEEQKSWNWEGAVWRATVNGTLNDTRRDTGWCAELKLPWRALQALGVPHPAEGLQELRILFLMVNQVELAPGRLSREMCFWPGLPQMNVGLHDEYGRLRLVESRKGDVLEGFSRIVRGQSRRGDALLPDFRGMSALWEYDTGMPDAVLIWETQPAAQELAGPVTFLFAGQTLLEDASSTTTDRALFELLVNGHPGVRFDPLRRENAVWEENGVRLEFQHRAGRQWPSGVFRLTVPAALLVPGKAARLEVRGTGKGPRTRFLLKAWTDVALMEQSATRER